MHQEEGTGGLEAPLAGNGGHGDRLRSVRVSRGKGEQERPRELERGRMERAVEQARAWLSKTRRARRGGAHATSEASHAVFSSCTEAAMKPRQHSSKFIILPQNYH